MWYPATVTEAATTEPVTVDDAKAWGHFDASDDDARIEAALLANREWVENFTGTYLEQQEVTVRCDGFDDFCTVPLAPVREVSISYIDTEGNNQTLAPSVYELRVDGLKTSIVLKWGQSWPGRRSGSRITVVADCGYEDVPPSPLLAIRMLTIADVDGNRTKEIEDVARALLENHRRF